MPTATAPARRRTRELEPLAGLSAIDAIARLRALELRPAIEPSESSPGDHGLVLAQEPGAGVEVCRGQLITLLIGERADNTAAMAAPWAGPAPPRPKQPTLRARAHFSRPGTHSLRAPRPVRRRSSLFFRRPATPRRTLP